MSLYAKENKLHKDVPLSWEEDGYTVTRTTAWSAPGCHEGCGVLCYVKDGKLVKVEGDPEHPFNQGRVCPRCLAVPDVVNHPSRIKTPLVRDPSKRGDPDAWEPISWDDAYDLWEKEFKRLQAQYGPGTVQGFQGTGRNIMWENQRLVYSMGSPHVGSYSSGLSCWMPRMVAHVVTVGNYTQVDCSQLFEDRWDHEGFKIPEVIVVCGNDCTKSSSDGFYGSWLVECVQRGSKLITIDPRLTWFAARSDIWLQIRPASDSAVAIAFLKTIIDENLYDSEFVDCWTYGFDELREALEQYDIDELCEKAWVDPEKLRQAARMYAAGNNSAVQLGLALDMQMNGVNTVQAILSAIAICKNLDAPGGNVYAPDPGGVSTFGWGWENLSDEAQKQLVGYYEYPMIGLGMRLDQPDMQLIQAELDDPQAYRAAYYMGTNPLTCMSCEDLSRVYAVLNKIEFNVFLDYIMTPSAQALGDLFLPIACWPEKKSIRSWYVNISATTPAVGLERNGDCKSDQEIIIDIGSRFNHDMFPWPDVDGMYDAMLEPAPINYEELTKLRWWYDSSIEYYRYEKGLFRLDGKPGFPTPTGRIELYSTVAESIGAPPLPFYSEPYEGPYSTPERYEKYPVITITGTRNVQFFHSEGRQVGKFREICKYPTFEINPEYAKEMGIEEGDWCWIENDLARIRQRAHLTNIIDKRCINLQSGWWFPEMDPHDDPMYGCWDVNPNCLIEPGHQGVTGFGADYKALLCKIYKVQEGEM
jgi:anaerobic selenocysteine-containing dehydrogenase